MTDEAVTDWITPRWPAPAGVRVWSTTRRGGVSRAPYDALNLAAHVGDDPAAVRANRARVREALGLPAEPLWLQQEHGSRVVAAAPDGPRAPRADGAWTDRRGAVCAVLTADCLPVVLCSMSGHWAGVAHAGWRGLAEGVLEALVGAAPGPPGELLAWLGPAIGPEAFEVGDEVRAAFTDAAAEAAEAFHRCPSGRWLADLYLLARLRLARAGVGGVFGGGWCTFRDPGRFYSYRRDGRTGRMATLVWLEPGRV